MTQVDKRRGIDVGPHMLEVSPVSYWYKHRHFKNDEEAQGAFTLAKNNLDTHHNKTTIK